MAQYFIRLDDLCPTNNLQKWVRFFDLFDQYQIKPIIAVIPANKDPKLLTIAKENPEYWQLVRELQQKEYIIGMHGFEHLYQTNHSGNLKANNRSEFAGLPYEQQEKKIYAATEIFLREKVKPIVFVAPAHTFDCSTLLAIKKWTGIEIISDGLLAHPYIKEGFKWIPVQLSEPVWKKNGTWTLNFHPETCSDELFNRLISFIALNYKDFSTIGAIKYQPFNFRSRLTENYLIQKRISKDFIKRIIPKSNLHTNT
ncbi:MAG: DUF2334 domain-containing protein [Pedobacter sp.]|nr:MAG: DUF2334 domain-containing protein [Pedobacter sp.]